MAQRSPSEPDHVNWRDLHAALARGSPHGTELLQQLDKSVPAKRACKEAYYT